jgi:hypothetical protein
LIEQPFLIFSRTVLQVRQLSTMRRLSVQSDSYLDEMIKEALDDSSSLLIWAANGQPNYKA